MSIVKLRWPDFIKPGMFYHIARAEFRAQAAQPSLHGHDFHEVFWVEAGKGWQLNLEGEQSLWPGDMLMVGPEDVHAFRAADEGLVLVNVAFKPEVMLDLHQRYFAESLWPWMDAKGERPGKIRLDAEGLERMRRRGEGLALRSNFATRLEVDRFLLNLVTEFMPPEPIGMERQPRSPWLQKAIAKWKGDMLLRRVGSRALVNLCGRSREHVSRTLRMETGQTLSQWIQKLRLEWAASALHMGDSPISNIALDAGFENLGYFYRKFRENFEMTPRGYRRRHQMTLRGEER